MQEKDTGRVESFSDGVFSVAITLLIVDFKVPHAAGDASSGKWWLLTGLAQLWPSIIAFILSFATILTMWVNHHALFKHAHTANNRLMFANGFLLLVVTFVPFPTAVLAEYLNTPSANAAAAFYCATYVLVSVGYNLLLAAVIPNRAPSQVGSPALEAALSRIKRAYRAGLVVYLAAVIASVFNAYAGLALCLSLWIIWSLLNYSPSPKAT